MKRATKGGAGVLITAVLLAGILAAALSQPSAGIDAFDYREFESNYIQKGTPVVAAFADAIRAGENP